MIGETVVILSPATGDPDRYGRPTWDWDNQSEKSVAGCAVAPRFEPESTDNGRQGVIIGLTLYAPSGTSVASTDRVLVRGVTYEVDGQPGDWVSPFDTRSRGVEFALKRVEG